MKEQNIFWELNVNYDSIHHYNEHQYVKDFFDNRGISDAVRENNLRLSVGFDGHNLEDYDADRVKNACHKLDELHISMMK